METKPSSRKKLSRVGATRTFFFALLGKKLDPEQADPEQADPEQADPEQAASSFPLPPALLL